MIFKLLFIGGALIIWLIVDPSLIGAILTWLIVSFLVPFVN